MNDYRAILIELLTAIDYNKDKSAFVEEFIKNLQLQSLNNLLLTLPQDKLDNMKQQLLSSSNDAQNSSKIIRSLFSEAQINSSIENASREAVTSYIESIRDVLSPEQEKKVLAIIEKYNSTA